MKKNFPPQKLPICIFDMGAMHFLHIRLKWYIYNRFKIKLLGLHNSLDESLNTWPICQIFDSSTLIIFLTQQKIDTLFSNHDSLTVRITVFKMSIVLYLYDYFLFLVSHNYIFTFNQISERLFLPTNRFDSAMRPCKRQGGVYRIRAWIHTQIRKIKC